MVSGRLLRVVLLRSDQAKNISLLQGVLYGSWPGATHQLHRFARIEAKFHQQSG